MKKIVFVCTGNTCRSPMAQGIFDSMLDGRGITDVECSSAGLFAMTGDEVAANAVKATQRFGADISGKRARRITEQLLDETDLFICMTPSHMQSLSMYVGDEKLMCLGNGISDPYGGDLERYILCANEIKSELTAAFDDIIGRLGDGD